MNREGVHADAQICGGDVPATPEQLHELSCSVVDDEPDVEILCAPGTRRHIKGTLKAGAAMEEIMEVLRLCIVRGAQACNLGVPILAEGIADVSEMVARP